MNHSNWTERKNSLTKARNAAKLESAALRVDSPVFDIVRRTRMKPYTFWLASTSWSTWNYRIYWTFQTKRCILSKYFEHRAIVLVSRYTWITISLECKNGKEERKRENAGSKMIITHFFPICSEQMNKNIDYLSYSWICMRQKFSHRSESVWILKVGLAHCGENSLPIVWPEIFVNFRTNCKIISAEILYFSHTVFGNIPKQKQRQLNSIVGYIENEIGMFPCIDAIFIHKFNLVRINREIEKRMRWSCFGWYKCKQMHS